MSVKAEEAHDVATNQGAPSVDDVSIADIEAGVQSTTIEEFDFSFNPKIPAAQIRDLATLRFIDAGESVILHGPVGVGKSMIAQALGHQACRRGHNVIFTKASRLLADLAGGCVSSAGPAQACSCSMTLRCAISPWLRPTIFMR
jgi:chromosomal replication initiation ATPase DnaA